MFFQSKKKNIFCNVLKKASVFFLLFLTIAIEPAQAIVLFQDDTFDEVKSQAILIGSNDAGVANTSIQFGNDVTSSENGNITWNISTNTFNFDHSIDITGGATVSGTATLNGATNINGTAAIGDGGDDISVNSNDWDISSAGAGTGFTGFTTSGILGSTGNLSVTGTASIGDGGDNISIDTDDWDISSAGVGSGFTGFTSTGAINYTGATYQGPQGAADPGTCSVGNYFYNTTSNLLKICTATNTWSPLLRTDTSQSFTSGTLTFNSGTTLTGNGAINFTAATSFRPPQGSADPGTCSVGQEFYNTTSNAMKVCTATNTWTIAVSPNGADLLDGVDGGSFLRSDASDNYTSGTLTTDNGTTLTVNGVANLGDGGDDININSNDWDVSSAGVASGFTGFTSTGTVNLSGTSSLRIREGADEATAACTTVKEIFLDTTENKFYICTVTGSPGTWVANASPNFEAVYAADGDQTLTTSNGNFTMAAGTGSINATATTGGINLNASTNGAVNIATGTSTGTVTVGGTAAQTIAVGTGAAAKTVSVGSTNTTSTTSINSGSGAVNINASNNQPTNINSGTSTGAMTFGNTLAGALSMTSGAAFTLAGGAASTISTTAGSISVQPAGTGTGNVQIGTGAGTATPDLIVMDNKNTAGDPTGTAGAIYYNSNLGKFRCFEASWFDCLRNPIATSVVDASITSPTPGKNPTFGTEIELLNPTRPSITPDNTSQRVLIMGAVQYTNPAGGDDTEAAIVVRIRRGSGSCAGTQVGADITTGFSDPIQSYRVPFFLVDSPATASAQSYTVCAALRDANGATATNATTPEVSIVLQQVGP